MQFAFDNGIYKVARITGPSHNFLGIQLTEQEVDITTCPLPIKEGEIPRIGSDEVLSQVKTGLALVNQEAEAKYFVSLIQFVPSDTKSPGVYEMLTVALIRRIREGWR